MTDFRNMTENEIFQKGKVEENYQDVCKELRSIAQKTRNGEIRDKFILEFSNAKKEAYFGSKAATFDKLLRKNSGAFEKVLQNILEKTSVLRYDPKAWSNTVESTYKMTIGQRTSSVVTHRDHFREAVSDSFDLHKMAIMNGHPGCGHWVPRPWEDVDTSVWNSESKATFKNYVVFCAFRRYGEIFLHQQAKAISDFVYGYSLEDYQADVTRRVVHEVRKLVANTGVPIVEVLRVLNNEFGEHLLKTVTET